MADLEAHAIRRDRRFLVRLAVGLLLGALAGAWVFGKLTSHETGSCAASLFGDGKAARSAR
jgi:hypothetical protein